MAKSIDVSKVNEILIITNETENAVELPIYPDNGTLVLEPGDELKYTVSSSREYLYYYQTCKALGLKVAVNA